MVKIQNNKTSKKSILIIGASIIGALLLTSGAVLAYKIYSQDNPIDNDYNPSKCMDIDDIYNCPSLKPVIYLYPTKTQDITVKLSYKGTLTATYPDYNTDIQGWEVTANPDGGLINHGDNMQYSYLFWEGLDKVNYDNFDTGFVVKGSESKTFLQNTLSKIGLSTKEYNEMIVYWLPKMEKNSYTLVHFAGKEYTDNAQLTITPKPDSILRVFMVIKSLDKYQTIQPQTLENFERNGFAVVEWGGTEI